MAEKVDYYWFKRGSATELCFALLRALVSGTFTRLDVVPYVREDGEPALRFHVRRTNDTLGSDALTAAQEPGINESHACPPRCGG